MHEIIYHKVGVYGPLLGRDPLQLDSAFHCQPALNDHYVHSILDNLCRHRNHTGQGYCSYIRTVISRRFLNGAKLNRADLYSGSVFILHRIDFRDDTKSYLFYCEFWLVALEDSTVFIQQVGIASSAGFSIVWYLVLLA